MSRSKDTSFDKEKGGSGALDIKVVHTNVRTGK